ncbi:MAG: hypothetical protein KI791_07120 [Cyclobacteriaceae bacterium]|nr:hypothetical protein [Cyclobacteriaceae bacterium SS2]
MKNHIYKLLIVTAVSVCLISCADERIEPETFTAPGGGTLTSYKAYALDSVPGFGNIYGRAVFYPTTTGYTLLQVSLYNVMEGSSHPAVMIAGTDVTELYTIENTGEGYSFGEFSTAKYFVINTPSFYAGLDTYDASIEISLSTADATVVTSGGIGLNADPVESN